MMMVRFQLAAVGGETRTNIRRNKYMRNVTRNTMKNVMTNILRNIRRKKLIKYDVKCSEHI